MVTCQFLEAYRLRDAEFPGLGASQLCEVGTASKCLTEIVGKRTDIGSSGNLSNETGAICPDALNLETVNLDGNGLHLYNFVFAGEFIRSDAVDFLCGIDGWKLLDASVECGKLVVNLGQGRLYAGNRTER